MSNIKYCSIEDIIISDHAPSFIGLSNCNFVTQNRPWRYNPFLNHDPNFEKFLNEQLNYFFKENTTPGVSSGLIWDTAKAKSYHIQLGLKKKRRKEQRKLELELHELQIKYNSSPSDELRNDIQMIKIALETLLTKKAEKSMFFARQRMYEFANKPYHFLANLLRNKAYTLNISGIRDSKGTLNYDNKEINNIFKIFYKELYTSQFNHQSKENMLNFFTKVELPQITNQQREDLCRPLTLGQIKTCIQLLPNSTALGPDGFNTEFFKKFSAILANP